MTLEELSDISKKHKVFIKVTTGWDDRVNAQYVKIHLRKGERRHNIYIHEGSSELSDVSSLIDEAILKII